jgi:glycerophosphoryl diester phosphodiesterase
MRRMSRAAALAILLVSATPAARAGEGFDLQGHRGARGLAPENTLAGFARALEVGVSTLELDVVVTRDGVVVASHDPLLNPDLTRDTRGAWLAAPGPAIVSLSLAELRAYDVGRLRPGSAVAQRFPRQEPRDGERLPTLADVFALAAQAPHVRFNVETKLDPRHPDRTPAPAAFADAVLAVARAAGVLERLSVQSFDWRTLRHVRAVAPAVETACLTVQQPLEDNVQRGRAAASPALAGLDADDFDDVPALVAAAGCRTWSPHAADLTPELLAAARRHGLRTIPWTVNEPAAIGALIDAGVDGLISDYPDRVREALAARGRPLPPVVAAGRPEP